MWALTSARTTENRDRWRRWGVSVAVALALHGGVVAAVLIWRYASISPPPAGDTGPFVIDLAPAPSQPIAAQAESPRPAAGGTVAERSRAPEQSGGGGAPAADHAAPNAADKPAATGEQKGEQKTAPAEASPGVTAPAHLENAGREDSEDKRTASGGGGSGGGGLAPAVPGGGSMSGPIDTRITIVSRFGWRAKTQSRAIWSTRAKIEGVRSGPSVQGAWRRRPRASGECERAKHRDQRHW